MFSLIFIIGILYLFPVIGELYNNIFNLLYYPILSFVTKVRVKSVPISVHLLISYIHLPILPEVIGFIKIA